jgi:hypothetical protein
MIFSFIQSVLPYLFYPRSNTTPLQKLITAQKGVSIDLEGLSRDMKAQSKELFTFGQSEAPDLKDGAISLNPKSRC